ncbi:MAG TPA: phosphoribosylaminoimidazolesuccinocarboxamide synthase [Thermomicrobiales bacterium]|nr:phosphoribosylaminoimidazolesuccinocarboxamide synthase [Thermomicrobiales bacterium]
MTTATNGDPTLREYPLFRRGKVRDVYDLGDELLLVATDRLSAFDVVLPTPIVGKGRLLTQLSLWWFGQMGGVVRTQLGNQSLADLDLTDDERSWLDGRTTRARKAERIDVECVVRGYLAGSGWKEYRSSGTLASESLPEGLLLGSALPAPVFTPAIKNDDGHDENISRPRLHDEIGDDLATTLETTSLEIFARATAIAAAAGFVLADSKFEFGFIDGELTLIDELLTPDSSRYWDAATLSPGKEPPSYDKQIVRDWLETTDWNKEAPGPAIPEEIVAKAGGRYQAVYDRLVQGNGDHR